jgi:hypothetical protein
VYPFDPDTDEPFLLELVESADEFTDSADGSWWRIGKLCV